MKKKILFINQAQFGYHVNSSQVCKYLKTDFDVSYLCCDNKKFKIQESNINIIYVPTNGNKLKRNIRFILSILKILNQQKFSLVFTSYFKGSSIIAILNNNKHPLHLDISTGNVSKSKVSRTFYNNILLFESLFFKSISIISEGLRKSLKINSHAFILPLGANPVSVNRHSTHKIHLLYVGTLTYRRIEETVEGLKIYLHKYPLADIHYTIIGDGWFEEDQIIKSKIIQLDLQNYITMTGYIPNDELKSYYEKCNIGITYIPITSYFEYQPSTKTYEYLMAGMPVIATKTYENKKIVNKFNGTLIDDNPESFADGITYMDNQMNQLGDSIIRETVSEFEWEKIAKSVKEKLL